MTVRRTLWALVFSSVFFIGLLAFAPASLMGYALNRASNGVLSLAETTGTIWQGSGVMLLHQKMRYEVVGSYRWNFKLLSATLQIQTDASTPATIRHIPFSGHTDIDNLRFTLPVSLLELAAPQLGPYQFQGILQVHADHLSVNNTGMNGQMIVDWLGAASELSMIRPLGDYRIILQGNGAALDGKLSTLSGKLLLAGTGRFDKTGGVSLNGTAQAAPGASAGELNELLQHIGPEVGPGVYALTLMPQSAAAR